MRTGARAATPAAGAPRHSFDDAWRRLSRLDPAQADDLARVRAAALSDDRDVRHVAARLFERAEPDDAHAGWSALLDDSSRTVRRAVVDAMVDTARESLRPLLERALADPDAWTRWKALRGLVELGIDPSRACVLDLAEDPDFRVRLEATGALRR
jgi:HEAT repeat protein